jgi:hypothetical protein
LFGHCDPLRTKQIGRSVVLICRWPVPPIGRCLQSLVLDPEEILFGQQLVEAGFIDPADDGCFLLPVAAALGQREG